MPITRNHNHIFVLISFIKNLNHEAALAGNVDMKIVIFKQRDRRDILG